MEEIEPELDGLRNERDCLRGQAAFLGEAREYNRTQCESVVERLAGDVGERTGSNN